MPSVLSQTIRTAAGARWVDAFGTRTALRDLQRRRLGALVEHARAGSSLYADLYAGLPATVGDPSVLPVTTKAQLMDGFDDWVTDPLVTKASVESFVGDLSRIGESYLGRYVVGTTSGTSGRPAIVLADGHATAIGTGLSAVRRRRGIPARAVLRDGLRIALVIATGGHFMAAAATEAFRRRSRWFAEPYRIFSVLDPMPVLVRRLNAFRPTMLTGYATALSALAHEAEAGRLRIDPSVVISSGETLTAPDRAKIEGAFRAVVRELYGSSEILHAACECPHGTIHVNEDWAILEPVDADHQPVAPGVASHTVLVTNLANRVQPIIRYDLGDSITVLPEPCRCGSPLMAIRPEGRRDDIMSLPARSGGEPVRILPLAISTIVEEAPGVTRAQVVLEPPDRLRFRIATDRQDPGDVAGEVRRLLRAWLQRQGVDDVTIEHDPTPPGRDERSGKFRAVTVMGDQAASRSSGARLASRPPR